MQGGFLLLILFQGFFCSVGILNDGIIQLSAEILAEFGDELCAQMVAVGDLLGRESLACLYASRVFIQLFGS